MGNLLDPYNHFSPVLHFASEPILAWAFLTADFNGNINSSPLSHAQNHAAGSILLYVVLYDAI